MMKELLLAAGMAGAVVSCGGGAKVADVTLSGLKPADFVSETQGKPLALYTLTNASGMEACITNYGGRLVSLMVPDKNGKMTDVVLGYGSIAEYLKSNGNFGALIGRFGNRIANASFTLDGNEYKLPANDGVNCLHGGPQGFDTKVWTAKQVDGKTLELTYRSIDGEAGFPGNLDVKVTYALTDDNAIDIRYEAVTDKPTVVNLTNHSYFNLSGKPDTNILDHVIEINADAFTVVGRGLIPTGEIRSVEGTPMDLRKPQPVGDNIDADYDQLKYGRGYDNNWVLNAGGDVSILASKVTSPVSGITMEVYTNEPGLQFYAGNSMSGRDIGKGGVKYPRRGALCLETQHYPDSPHQPSFPSTTLNPGEKYYSRCMYKFLK